MYQKRISPCCYQLQFLNAWQQFCSCWEVTIQQCSTSKLKVDKKKRKENVFSVFYTGASEARLYFLRKRSGVWQQMLNDSYTQLLRMENDSLQGTGRTVSCFCQHAAGPHFPCVCRCLLMCQKQKFNLPSPQKNSLYRQKTSLKINIWLYS